jgi:hypothetical protein
VERAAWPATPAVLPVVGTVIGQAFGLPLEFLHFSPDLFFPSRKWDEARPPFVSLS